MKKSLSFWLLAIGLIALVGQLDARLHADIVGYWRFEEGVAGNTASGVDSILDSSVGNHGTPSGNPVYNSDVSLSIIPGNGLSNSVSLDFDGSGDTVLIGTDAALNSAGSFTVEFWMRSSGSTAGQHLLVDKSHGFVDQTGWFFQSDPGGNVGFGLGSNGGFSGIGSAANLFDDQWHHLAGTYDGNEIELFVDGLSQGTSIVGVYDSNTRDIRVGSASNNGRFFDGLIDELRISDEVLAPSQFLSAPEPSSILLLGLSALGGLGIRRRG